MRRRRHRVADIRAIVCRHFGVTDKEIRSPDRHVRVVSARQVGMHLARRMSGQSLPQIARHFGRGHHTTALHADRKIEATRSMDPAFNAGVRAIVGDVHRAAREDG